MEVEFNLLSQIYNPLLANSNPTDIPTDTGTLNYEEDLVDLGDDIAFIAKMPSRHHSPR